MCVRVCVSVMNAPFLTIVLIWTSSLSIKIYYYYYCLLDNDKYLDIAL